MSVATGYGKEPEPSTSSSVQLSQQCRHFQLFDILLATENFDESLVIGKGGFGKVYRGTIFNGSATVLAAIKRLDPSSNQGAPEFWAEVEMLSKLRHCNLVSLFGYCNDEEEMILVYEYMPNGTLEDHLHKLGTPLSWIQRLNICIGAGRGLHYLHTGTGIDFGVIHRDVKTSNILLQESWAAKISDFGLSKIGPTNQPMTYVNTLVKGTFGYFDPDYYATGNLTRKTDVYAFGVVLLEVLCRKRAIFNINGEALNLANWAQESIKEGSLKNIIDFDIRGQASPKCSKEFVRIAERCLHSSPKKRSTMAEVLSSLESILSLQEKFNNSVQPAGRTILDRMVNMLPFPSNGENTAQGDSKPSSEGKSRIGTNTVGDDNNTFLDTSELPADYEARSLKEFKYDDLKKATKNFSPDMLLGEGGFGKVYLGWVDQNTFAPSKHGVGVPVAVKRHNQDGCQGHPEWQAEVSFLGRLAHPNIISLLGYCSNEHERLLVYEYMANKSFDGFLLTNRPNAPNTAEPLSWGTRLMIMIGVARGLTYLHSSQNRVMCRGVKAGDILLDNDFTAKLGDFGLVRCSPKIGESHVSTRVMGTYGYADPAYISTGHLYVKSDIYSFGVVLLETITGQPVLDSNRPAERRNLVDWVRPILGRKKRLKTIMDPRLEQNYPLEGAFKCAALALRCLETQPKDRPSSEEVLQSLEEIYAAKK
ncbi:serine/threonine/dual specificity protein kinase, catalytic domain-containing protein [Artemisia annua]|uniref:non-specific serine/threonine protein kinase n=1 Tax=Artemisia annua TaxID=35608 RepID=A0A2U1QEU6_ARTAN|nr:serine/threonine/dual specificity protein kinase, catalytic domain-containing protein [Artemisia annua]